MRSRAFTIIELLVVVAIIGALVAILLPALGKVRDSAKQTASRSNLRQLGQAHANYASEWEDRQFTLSKDDISTYGNDPVSACENHFSQKGEFPPAILLGWGKTLSASASMTLRSLIFDPNATQKNLSVLAPISFYGPTGNPDTDIDRMGWFRLPNARQFSQYASSGRFYDPMFYAPKDEIAVDMAQLPQEQPYEFTPLATMQSSFGWCDNHFCYSSYSMSPAALFSPDVMRSATAGGWQDPWSLGAGMRTPALSQARYTDLKTQMLEHHWLQNRSVEACNSNFTTRRQKPYQTLECNEGDASGDSDSCQPWFFNQAENSTPNVVFYDGHVDSISVAAAMRADGRAQGQSGVGLWSRDTPFGLNGYFIDFGFDAANTSFHIFTTDGILGRDITTE